MYDKILCTLLIKLLNNFMKDDCIKRAMLLNTEVRRMYKIDRLSLLNFLENDSYLLDDSTNTFGVKTIEFVYFMNQVKVFINSESEFISNKSLVDSLDKNKVNILNSYLNTLYRLKHIDVDIKVVIDKISNIHKGREISDSIYVNNHVAFNVSALRFKNIICLCYPLTFDYDVYTNWVKFKVKNLHSKDNSTVFIYNIPNKINNSHLVNYLLTVPINKNSVHYEMLCLFSIKLKSVFGDDIKVLQIGTEESSDRIQVYVSDIVKKLVI